MAGDKDWLVLFTRMALQAHAHVDDNSGRQVQADRQTDRHIGDDDYCRCVAVQPRDVTRAFEGADVAGYPVPCGHGWAVPGGFVPLMNRIKLPSQQADTGCVVPSLAIVVQRLSITPRLFLSLSHDERLCDAIHVLIKLTNVVLQCLAQSCHWLSTELNLKIAKMDVLEGELAKLQREASLSQGVDDVDKILEQLLAAREAIAAGKITMVLASL